jgi:chromosome segregation ATPase
LVSNSLQRFVALEAGTAGVTSDVAKQQHVLEELLREKAALSTQLQLARQSASAPATSDALATPEGMALMLRREQARTRLTALSDELASQAQAHEDEMTRLKAAVAQLQGAVS